VVTCFRRRSLNVTDPPYHHHTSSITLSVGFPGRLATRGDVTEGADCQSDSTGSCFLAALPRRIQQPRPHLAPTTTPRRLPRLPRTLHSRPCAQSQEQRSLRLHVIRRSRVSRLSGSHPSPPDRSCILLVHHLNLCPTHAGPLSSHPTHLDHIYSPTYSTTDHIAPWSCQPKLTHPTVFGHTERTPSTPSFTPPSAYNSDDDNVGTAKNG
jgi:hypothetical protein